MIGKTDNPHIAAVAAVSDEMVALMPSQEKPTTAPFIQPLPAGCPVTPVRKTEDGAIFRDANGLTIHLSRACSRGEIEHLFAGHTDYLVAHWPHGIGPVMGIRQFQADAVRYALMSAAHAASTSNIPSHEGEREASQAQGEVDKSFPPYLSTAAQDVLAERRRQIEGEGWTPEHDDEHGNAEMALAAAGYAINAFRPMPTPAHWPWDLSWWKPSTPRRDLIKAAALLIAEIERIDRAEGR